MILECSNCPRDIEGEFNEANPPGRCVCRGFRYWKAVKERRPRTPGFVRVLSDKGWQELKGPHFQVDPNGWKMHRP